MKQKKYKDSKAFLEAKKLLGSDFLYNQEYKITNVDGIPVTVEVDIVIPSHSIGIEVDGDHHLEKSRIKKDNHKDMQLYVLYGLKVFRVTDDKAKTDYIVNFVKQLKNVSPLQLAIFNLFKTIANI